MASLRRARRNKHDGKIHYETKEVAYQTAHALSAKFGARLLAYRCDFCTGWHVGNKSKLRFSRTV